MIQNNIFKNLWSILYAASLTFGTYYAAETLIRFDNEQSFIGFSLVLLGVFLLEVFVTWQFNANLHRQQLDAELIKYELMHITHKILLPITLYIGIVGYAYYNLGTISLTALLVIVFCINYALFYNLRAYFEHNNIHEHETEVVFDIIKFILFFTSINVFLNNIDNHADRLIWLSIVAAFVSFILLELITWRMSSKHLYSTQLSIVASAAIGILFFTLANSDVFTILQSTIILSLLFYILIAYIHHVIHSTLTKYIIFEYLLVFVSIVGVLYGIQ